MRVARDLPPQPLLELGRLLNRQEGQLAILELDNPRPGKRLEQALHKVDEPQLKLRDGVRARESVDVIRK